jgi:type I restriction enzyme S subunit
MSIPDVLDYIEMIARGGTRQRISRSMLGDLQLITPPKNEQKQIAEYLDHKTAKIDSLIEKKKRLIELLKEERTAVINHAVTKGLDPDAPMKDSGIEWLGEIPAHWQVKKLKHILYFFDHIRVPLSSDERGRMTERVYDYYGASGIIDKVENYLFDGEYILIGEDGANLLTRSTALAFKATGQFWVNNHAHILRPKEGNIDYFVNLLEGIDYSIYVSGSAQPKLTQERLGSIEIVNPPVQEQYSILHHIESETNRINSIISKSEKEIELLQEYCTVLISEVVTGKIDVREEKI